MINQITQTCTSSWNLARSDVGRSKSSAADGSDRDISLALFFFFFFFFQLLSTGCRLGDRVISHRTRLLKTLVCVGLRRIVTVAFLRRVQIFFLTYLLRVRAGLTHRGAPCQKVMGALPFRLRPSPPSPSPLFPSPPFPSPPFPLLFPPLP